MRSKVKRIIDSSGLFMYNLFHKVHVFIQVIWLTLRYKLVVSISTMAIIVTILYNVLDFTKEWSNELMTALSQLNHHHLQWVVVSFIMLVGITVTLIYLYKRRTYTFKKISDIQQLIIKENLKLSEELIRAGYEKKQLGSTREMVIISPKVNDYIREESKDISLDKSIIDYRVPSEILNYIPLLLHRKIANSNVVFNGKLLGLKDELFVGMKQLDCCKVSYFESQVTDEIIYYDLFNAKESNEKISGIKLSSMLESRDEVELQALYLNSCTNYIGISTLLITNDNYVFFQIQGNKSNVNKGNYAPSGSGSVDYKDWKDSAEKSLHGVLASAAERELLEEFGLNEHDFSKNITFSTKIIGYARLFERGGKPDFFAVTKCNIGKERLEEIIDKKAKLAHIEQHLSNVVKYPVLLKISQGAILEDFIEEHQNQSVQNLIFNELLKNDDLFRS